MVLRGIEEKLGLPPLDKGLGLVTGTTGKRISTLLTRLEKLAQDKTVIKDVILLLQMVEKLDQAGTLERLDDLLKQLGPLTKGKTAMQLVEKLDKIERLVSVLMKEE